MRNISSHFACSATVIAQPWNSPLDVGLCLLTLSAGVYQLKLKLNFSNFGFSKGPCGSAAAHFMILEIVAFAILESQILTFVQGNCVYRGNVVTALWLSMSASTEM